MNNDVVRIVTLEELCEQLCIGKNAAYDLLRSGKIKAFRINRVWKIPQDSINGYIRSASK